MDLLEPLSAFTIMISFEGRASTMQSCNHHVTYLNSLSQSSTPLSTGTLIGATMTVSQGRVKADHSGFKPGKIIHHVGSENNPNIP